MDGDRPAPQELPTSAQKLGSFGRVVRNSTINLAAILIGNLVAVVMLVKRLSPDVLGRYYLIFSLIMIVGLIVEAGVSTVLTRRIVQDFGRWKQTAREAAGLLVVVSLVSLAVLIAMGAIWAGVQSDPQVLLLFVGAGLACVAIQVGLFSAGVFRAFERFEYESVAKILQGFVFVGLLYVFVDGTANDLVFAVAAFAGSHLAAAIFLCSSYIWKWGRPGCRLNVALIRDWLTESVPLGLGDVCRRVTLQIGTVLLGVLAPLAAVGIYNFAYRPLGFLRLVPRVILTVLFPSFSQLAKESRASLDRALARSIRLLWMGSLPIVVVIVVCADHLVLLIANEKYADASLPMRLLIWVVCFSFISTQFRFYLTALGRQSVFTRLTIAIFFLETVSIAALIPAYSYLGACLGVLLGEVVFLAAGFVACYQLGLTGVEWGALLKSGVLAAVMAVLLWPFRELPLLPLSLLSGAAACVYFAGCALTGVLHRDELRRLLEGAVELLRATTARSTPNV